MSIKNFQKLSDPKLILHKLIDVRLGQLFPNNYCSKNRAIFY